MVKKALEEKLADLGEKEILNRLKYYMDAGQIDDDTALIKSSKKQLIINTDMIVEDVHFSEKTLSPRNVGWKAVATNISDLAASGVEDILGITVGLIAPSSTSWLWIDNAYEGITKALTEFGGKLWGGDCSNGIQKAISITAIGTQGKLNLHRSNAQNGDFLVTSGSHGLSRLGLSLLLSEPLEDSIKLTESLKHDAIKAHQQPEPPLEALRSLKDSHPWHIPWRAAAADSSDGLLEAVRCIVSSSQCKAIIDVQNLPFANHWPKGEKWRDWCLEGGEDFELIVSLPPIWAQAWIKSFPSCKKIGEIRSGTPEVIWSTGKTIESNSKNLYQHF